MLKRHGNADAYRVFLFCKLENLSYSGYDIFAQIV